MSMGFGQQQHLEQNQIQLSGLMNALLNTWVAKMLVKIPFIHPSKCLEPCGVAIYPGLSVLIYKQEKYVC